MKKISKINWGLFKESPRGKETIAKFSRLSSADCSIEEMLSIAKFFTPLYFSNVTKKEEEGFLIILQEDFCAYLYGYELPLIKEEMESDYSAPKPIRPENAWILVGNYEKSDSSLRAQ